MDTIDVCCYLQQVNKIECTGRPMPHLHRTSTDRDVSKIECTGNQIPHHGFRTSADTACEQDRVHGEANSTSDIK